ncbi:MAG: hypothetical protein ACRDCE_17710 [Cetobacterium sp.]|uniref:hypothetical protein n=1 Tax=Cetobacterium sp. TaxID=2071632 RepID=UPI003EE6A64E
MDKIDSKAIGGLPGWIGSQAVNETGERWMSSARTKMRLPAVGWMSEMANRSREIRIDLTSSNHNFDTNWLHQQMVAAAGGSWPGDDAIWRIVVHGGVQLVSNHVNNQVMWLGGAIRGRVIIENHGWIWGRGGDGGAVTGGHENNAQNGNPGGHAIYREGHVTLEIVNYGIIAGGGGGGGAAYTFSSAGGGRHYGMGGGGGRPFGAGGYTSGMNHPRPGSAGSINGGGGGGVGGDRGESYGGGGGDIGANGGGGSGNKASRAGGASGYAIAGGGPLAMTVQGDIRGPVAW